jgi:uncharacterized protein
MLDPSYSIKDIEKFYREARQGEVQSAGASIVYYERFLETREPQLLVDIQRYNEDDVRSLQQLHEWLLRQRPPGLPWMAPHPMAKNAMQDKTPAKPSLPRRHRQVSGIRCWRLAGH